MTDDSSNEVFQGETNGSLLQYPESAPQLQAGKTYFWTVEPTGSVVAEPSKRVGFVVLSAEQRAKIESEIKKAPSPAKRAEIFTAYRLWYDTVEAYQNAIDHQPDSAELLEKRGTVLSQIAVTHKLAEEDFKKAEEIKSKPPRT